MASKITGRPIALLGLVGPESTWFKSVLGMDPGTTPNGISFCARAVEQDAVFEIGDARADSRFAGNPLVTGDKPVVFYAGAPVRVKGIAVGTLCVIDHVPHQLSPLERELLLELASLAEHVLTTRYETVRMMSAYQPVPGT